MKLADKSTCTGCGACASVCNFDAITMIPDDDGFFVPQIDEVKCKNCGACEKVCHVNKEHTSVLKTSDFMLAEARMQKPLKPVLQAVCLLSSAIWF